MGKARIFTTLPVGLISDSRPTALDIRCAMAIALRDGMSKIKGKGGGCYAKFATLAADAGTDVTNFSKSLSRLVKWGYVSREPQQMDKRRFTLRINYPDPRELGEPTNKHGTNKVGEVTNNRAEIVGEVAPDTPEIVGEGEPENPSFSKETDRHYSSLREELDFDKSRELNSTKWRGSRNSSFGDLVASQSEGELNQPEDGLGGVSIWQHLPSNIETLSLGAQVAKIENAYGQVGRDADSIDQDERQKLSAWLSDIADTCIGGDLDATGQQANRLYEELAVW